MMKHFSLSALSWLGVKALFQPRPRARPLAPANPPQWLELAASGAPLHAQTSNEPLWAQGLAGFVWVTIEGDPADHLLAPGDCLAVPAGRKLVAEAVGAGPARLGLQARRV